MRKINLLPNVITAFGLSCGLFIIFRTAMLGLGELTPEILTQLSGVLLLAALADLLDGAVARKMHAESEFGGFFDSMSDGVTFGVAPAIMIVKSLNLPAGSELSYFLVACAMVFCVCGILRLVRYNVKDVPAGKDLPLSEKGMFTGLPIPASAAALISLNLFLMGFDGFSPENRIYLTLFSLVFLGYLMVSRLKFPSFKQLRVKVASFQVVASTAILAVFLFYGLLHHFDRAFFALSWGYLIVSLTLSLIRLFAGRKSKTLVDFEPEDE